MLFMLLLFWQMIPAVVHGAPAASTPDFNYDKLVTDVFWHALYPGGGWTLYCGYHFDTDRMTADGKVVSVGHIYPTSWMLKFLGCHSRLQCHRKDGDGFDHMEADLHNLYPVWEDLDVYRDGASFGMVPGGARRVSDCDIKWRAGVLQPRPIARGNIARAMLYMHTTYHLPLAPAELKLMKKWNHEDPPSEQERDRNAAIERIQGRRNPFIDKPSLADHL